MSRNAKKCRETMATKMQIQDQLIAIEAVVAAARGGLLIDEIAEQTDLDINRRTLQRRLRTLVESGRIAASGATRATRYAKPPRQEDRQGEEPQAARQQDLFVPLSQAGSNILRQVTRPLAARDAVPYDRDFLDSYRPNVTSYLSEAERQRLHQLGGTHGTVQEAGTYALQILNRLLIDLSWNSSRLEGNTYSLLETQKLIALGQSVETKAPRDAQMILNHKAAIEFLVQSADETAFDRRTILNLHALLADNLLDDPGAAGRLRTEPVGIGGSAYMPPEVPQVIEECFDTVLTTASAITDPFEQAFFVMVQLPYLQPFIDVNKRVSRLALNLPLIKNNLAPLSFIAVPDSTYTHALLGVYELRKIELLKDVFLWAYEKSSARYVAVRQTLGEPDPFRLRHRANLRDVVADVIRQTLDQIAASKFISAWAQDNIEADERAQFIEVIETELLSLHEGNFARYGVRPSEFISWQNTWQGA